MEDLNKKEIEALKLIRNSVVHTGSKPTYKKLMEFLNYQSPRSVNLIIKSLTEKGYLQTDEHGKIKIYKYPEVIETKTVEVNLLGYISCGSLNFAEQNIEATFSISTMLAKPPYEYFILRARGDSMNATGVKDGDLVLMRKQSTAHDGDIVAALVDDNCTLKEFYRREDFIILKPNSLNTEYKPILLTSDFTILGKLVAVLPQL